MDPKFYYGIRKKQFAFLWTTIALTHLHERQLKRKLAVCCWTRTRCYFFFWALLQFHFIRKCNV